MSLGLNFKTTVEKQSDQSTFNRVISIFFVGSIISLFFCHSERAFAEEDLEAQRLRGFYEQKQKNEKSDLLRLSTADEVTRAREKWEKDRELSIVEYKKEKLSQRKRIDEDSPQYYENLEKRVKRLEDRENDRVDFVKDRSRYLSQKKGVRLSEMVEYGLNVKSERIDPKKREELYNKIAKSGSTAGKSSGYSGGGFSPSSGGAPPPIPAPSTPPEFFDGEIPPPPPPPLDGFDEPPPPPIFDDPDF